MKSILYHSLILFFLLSVTSCEKVIDLNLGNKTSQLVIEGNITDIDGPQTIKLSTNVPFSNTNTYPAVTGAQVKVVDQSGNNYQFTEGPAGTYSINPMAGIAGNTYTLMVSANGNDYTANSTMPVLVPLDSVTAKNSEFDNENNKKQIVVHYQDPAGVLNQYRFIVYVNDVQIKRVFTNNDDFTDGRYVNFNLRQDDIDIHPGDKVTVEMQCIDKPIYTYWFTLMQQGQEGPGGSVTPSNPPNNITPTTLGYFSAHTTQRITIIVK